MKGTLENIMGDPLVSQSVTLLDAEGKIASRALTDKSGAYGFANLREGLYTLILAEHMRLPIQVSPDSRVATLRAVLPETGAYSAAALTTIQWTWIIIAGAVVGGGTVAIVAASKSSGSSSTPAPATVSP